MIEKIALALVITFALYWSVQNRPQQRSNDIAIDRYTHSVALVRV
jgi:ABC-type nickel/cobalt efflux system permease component RcnA